MAVSTTQKIAFGGLLFSDSLLTSCISYFTGTHAHQSQTLSQRLNRQTDYGKIEVGP